MNIVHIEKAENITDEQRERILEAIREYNSNLFDANDYVEEEIEDDLDFTYIEGRDSYKINELFRTITSIIRD